MSNTNANFFAPSPAAATATLQTIMTVAARLGKSRSRLKEICREIGLEPIRPAGSAAWLFDEPRICRLQDELARREREGRR
jgi:hypothetical protein